MGHGGLDAVVEIPTVELGDAFFQHLVALRIGGQRLKFLDEAEDVARAVADVFEDGLLRVEGELLREVADDQAPARGDFATVGGVQAGEDFEEGGLAGAIAPDEADAGAFVEGEGGGVEDDAVVEGDDEVFGGEKGGGGITHGQGRGWESEKVRK